MYGIANPRVFTAPRHRGARGMSCLLDKLINCIFGDDDSPKPKEKAKAKTPRDEVACYHAKRRADCYDYQRGKCRCE